MEDDWTQTHIVRIVGRIVYIPHAALDWLNEKAHRLDLPLELKGTHFLSTQYLG